MLEVAFPLITWVGGGQEKSNRGGQNRDEEKTSAETNESPGVLFAMARSRGGPRG